jgi:glutathione S-transferase
MTQMENQNQEYGLAQRELAVKSLGVYNDIIASREYIAGERFTYADIQMVTSLQFLVRLNRLDLKDYNNLNEYINQVSSKPSFSL